MSRLIFLEKKNRMSAAILNDHFSTEKQEMQETNVALV